MTPQPQPDGTHVHESLASRWIDLPPGDFVHWQAPHNVAPTRAEHYGMAQSVILGAIHAPDANGDRRSDPLYDIRTLYPRALTFGGYRLHPDRHLPDNDDPAATWAARYGTLPLAGHLIALSIHHAIAIHPTGSTDSELTRLTTTVIETLWPPLTQRAAHPGNALHPGLALRRHVQESGIPETAFHPAFRHFLLLGRTGRQHAAVIGHMVHACLRHRSTLPHLAAAADRLIMLRTNPVPRSPSVHAQDTEVLRTQAARAARRKLVDRHGLAADEAGNSVADRRLLIRRFVEEHHIEYANLLAQELKKRRLGSDPEEPPVMPRPESVTARPPSFGKSRLRALVTPTSGTSPDTHSPPLFEL